MAATSSTVRPFMSARTFNVPRELAFKAWAEPDRMSQWWGPKGYMCLIAKFELRPGGVCHYCLTGPGSAQSLWGKSVFREVVPGERLVFVNSFSDERLGITRHPLSATWPLQMYTTITFTDAGPNQTAIATEWMPIDPTPEEIATFNGAHESMKIGWGGTFDQLAEYLASAQV